LKPVYTYRLFEPNPFGNGGERRTAQISALLKECDISPQKIPLGYDRSPFRLECVKNFFSLIRFYFSLSLIIRRPLSIREVLRKVIWASRLKGIFTKEFENPGILLYETSQFELAPIVPYFKKRGFPLVCFQHNMESLVPDQKSGLTRRKSPFWMFEEIRFLRLFDKVFTISREETLLLGQYGINASYLPYYPHQETMEQFLKIRKQREANHGKNRSGKKLLIVGSALNPPTKSGILNRIEFFRNHPDLHYKVNIIGYNTEELSDYARDLPDIKILGSLSDKSLAAHLTNADAILIHQPNTSGALTRIIEFLISGIPVIANFSSCRNYHGMNGLISYDDDNELLSILKMENLPVPGVPQFPKYETGRCKEYMRKLYTQS
jgi:glycosyltransferase involved in cell wall biosynthesis